MHGQTTFENLGTVITDYIKQTTIKMTKELELQWELEPIAKETIIEVFIDFEIVHIATLENKDQYYAIDCHDQYFAWYVENIAEDEDLITFEDYDHEDGYTSTSKGLNPDIDIYSDINVFSQFVRSYTNKYWLKENQLEIELNQLLHDLSKFKVIDKSKASSDVRKKINSIMLTCRNIGLLS